MAVGNGLKAADKTVASPAAPKTAVRVVIQQGPEAEFVKTPPELPPGTAAHKGPRYRRQAVPENRQKNNN
jgi:hypothetical protein